MGECTLKIELFGLSFEVPVLVVEGQIDQIVIGTNILKPLIRQLKTNESYWSALNKPDGARQNEHNRFLRVFSNLERWRGETIPDKVGTVKLKRAVTLKPLSEHLVWACLPPGTQLSAGSTVIVEPSTARCVHRNVLVGRVVSPLWGDGWLPVKLINPTPSEITLCRNTKLADVYPCIALEDFDMFKEQEVLQNTEQLISNRSNSNSSGKSSEWVWIF